MTPTPTTLPPASMTNACRPCMGISNRRSQSEAVYFSLFQGSRSASSRTTAAKSSGLYDLMVAGDGSMVRRSVAPTEQFGDGHQLEAFALHQLLSQPIHHLACMPALAVGVEDDDAAAAQSRFQVLKHPLRRQARIRIP